MFASRRRRARRFRPAGPDRLEARDVPAVFAPFVDPIVVVPAGTSAAITGVDTLNNNGFATFTSPFSTNLNAGFTPLALAATTPNLSTGTAQLGNMGFGAGLLVTNPFSTPLGLSFGTAGNTFTLTDGFTSTAPTAASTGTGLTTAVATNPLASVVTSPAQETLPSTTFAISPFLTTAGLSSGFTTNPDVLPSPFNFGTVVNNGFTSSFGLTTPLTSTSSAASTGTASTATGTSGSLSTGLVALPNTTFTTNPFLTPVGSSSGFTTDPFLSPVGLNNLFGDVVF